MEGEEFDGKDKKHIIFTDPVGNASLNVGVVGHVDSGILNHKESASI